MKRLLISILAALLVCATHAQTAIINDPDGFCNARAGASSQSKVVDTLSNGRIVFALEEGAEGNWLNIDYHKGGKTISAYVHKSRVTFLNSLTTFKTTALNDSLLKLQLDTLYITMSSRRFSSKGRQLKYDKPPDGYKLLRYVDGKFPWGTDGNTPREEYSRIQYKQGDRTMTFHPKAFSDLFEPGLQLTTAYLDKGTGKIYIEAYNSDGAGSYLVVWTLKDGKVSNREIFIPF